MKNQKTMTLVQAAMIAAIYVVLVFIFNYWSFGVIQFRIAEALTILPYFTPAAVPGLFAGCFLANFLGGAVMGDVVFGSLATLIGAIGTYFAGKAKFKWLAPVPPIIANTLIVPFVLKYCYGTEEAIPYMMLTVGIGEVIVCGIFGSLLLAVVEKNKNAIFRQEMN
ncbi:MAG: QueT transporter family protein [Lachnospiraceae bacterium]|nr:QueT transporter family protein [Lachnospiraceae bacterium]